METTKYMEPGRLFGEAKRPSYGAMQNGIIPSHFRPPEEASERYGHVQRMIRERSANDTGTFNAVLGRAKSHPTQSKGTTFPKAPKDFKDLKDSKDPIKPKTKGVAPNN